MKSYTINENFTAIADQQIFTLQKPFVSGSIDILLNGTLQILGEDQSYVELPDVGRVVFNTPLLAGDMISVRSNLENTTMEVVSAGKYDNTIRLNEN